MSSKKTKTYEEDIYDWADEDIDDDVAYIEDIEISEIENDSTSDHWDVQECPLCKTQYSLMETISCPECGFGE